MGRLAGFGYHEDARCLRTFGSAFDRPGPAGHEVLRHTTTGRKVTIPHHSRDIAERTLREILREAGISVNDSLKTRWSVYPNVTI